MTIVERASSKISLALQDAAWLRALVRRGEFGLIGLALLAGMAAGGFVAVISSASAAVHYLAFGHHQLSNLAALEGPAQALAPAVGGLVLGLSGLLILGRRPRRPVDPIEANALHGGRMSIRDSLVISVQTVISNGFGASVGLEAAYTQMSSGFASWLGCVFRLRRADMRMLVACGSAGAIAAAFGAPLTGAFYAFELILGTYTPFALAPVGVAAIGGILVSRWLGLTGAFMGKVAAASTLTEADLLPLLILGIICAAFGIAIMRSVKLVESLFSWSGLPSAVRPAIGGLIVGGLAFGAPQALGSGHSALFDLLFGAGPPAAGVIMAALVLKSVASAISIGSGFRGGLFFASLFLGGLTGRLYAHGLGLIGPALVPDAWVCAVVGMAAFAVAIVGGPMTMSFLALETTGDVPLSLMLLGVSTIVSVIVRRAFGYSFATWRLHLRGESIRSAQDVGWIRDLTVAGLMRTDLASAPADLPIAEFVARFPLGSAQWVAAVDPSGRYAGLIFLPDAHLADREADAGRAAVAQVARFPDRTLTPDMNIMAAAQAFENSEAEALAVVDNDDDRRVLGLLTEAHVLRRYTEELDKARRNLSGEAWAADA
ncbi:chloride channel protein [Methylocapsa acidiphila]|uniref:chloride channel protein n=1 Tax=Methylocapsa acidiphila TaxID=133552 RepID=UPI0004176A2A|nr:chloride channel protein [Methylocapsa acidiphila]